jgi:hypothetical protein
VKQVVTPIVLGASFLIAPSVALAAPVVLSDAQLDAVTAGADVHLYTGTTGQPSQTIGVTIPASSTPGIAVNATGSAFNPNGVSGAVYAGNGTNNANNPKSISQYDVAGFEQFHTP